MPDVPSSRVQVDVTLDLDLADPVAVQAEALKAVPPLTARIWPYRTALHHVLLWPLVTALRHSRVVDLHGAKITHIRTTDSAVPHEAGTVHR